MSSPEVGGEDHRGIAAAITEVSERASALVREEIELAKAEVTQKATRLAKGAVIGIVAGVFFMTALFFFLIGCAWLLYFYLPGSDFAFFWGFFAMAAILVLLGLIAGLIAAKAVKRGAPPTPDLAIEEARLIRDTVSAPEPQIVSPRSQPAPSAPSAPPPTGEDGPFSAAQATPEQQQQQQPPPYGAAAPQQSSAPQEDA